MNCFSVWLLRYRTFKNLFSCIHDRSFYDYVDNAFVFTYLFDKLLMLNRFDWRSSRKECQIIFQLTILKPNIHPDCINWRHLTFPLIHLWLTFVPLYIKRLSPSKLTVMFFLHKIKEFFEIAFSKILLFWVLFLILYSCFKLQHSFFELIEVNRVIEHLNGIIVYFFVVSVVLFKTTVKSLNFILTEFLLKLCIDRTVYQFHILLKRVHMTMLILFVVIEASAVFSVEIHLTISEVLVGHNVTDLVENLVFFVVHCSVFILGSLWKYIIY